MSSVATVTIHPSQFPENVHRDLVESLRTGEVNHKFHYDSVKQTQKWLALHEAYSPARTDADGAAIYDRGFVAAAERIKSKRVHVIGVGCGGGQKDARLLKRLRKQGKEVFYTPSDVSTAMVLVARQTATEVIPEKNCSLLVCDLATAGDLPQVIQNLAAPKTERLITFFGMIPNFEPETILPRLSALVRPDDMLLFSANLAPGSDYAAGVKKILPLYDNALTRDWLMTFLLDLGVEKDDGKLDFCIEDDPGGARLKRVAGYFRFQRKKEIAIGDERFRFGPEKAIRLFFSYRHTPQNVPSLLGSHAIEVIEQWTTKSEEEGVFLCRRNLSPK
jgi:L-histidine N-alpha-methyltransferase